MESTYSHGAHERRTEGKRTVNHRMYGRKRNIALAPRERKRLLQLGVCVVLFLTVFLGRGIFPEHLNTIRGQLLAIIHTDTDFEAAFSNLGQSISAGEPVLDTLEELWVDVFGGNVTVTTAFTDPLEHAPIYRAEQVFLATDHTAEDILHHRLGVKHTEAASEPQEIEPPVTVEEPSQTETPEPAYDGTPLPEGSTMEKLSLGLDQTVAPVMAVVSSNFGWREHPIEGGVKFHAGTDLAAPYGDPVGAFADGVVDYIGESPAYGMYLQISHAGGVTSFYAHCSKLCVQQGQEVKMGDKVAEVGDTGEATGPHLHFELKLNGERLNPLYYIETA